MDRSRRQGGGVVLAFPSKDVEEELNARIQEVVSRCAGDCGACPPTGCTADACESNDSSSSSSTPMSPGQTRCSASICGSDVDWFGFDYPASATVTITFNHAAGDLDLEIYSSLTLAYLSGSYGTSNSETVTLSGLPAGYYWARVYGYSGAENPDYCITVN